MPHESSLPARQLLVGFLAISLLAVIGCSTNSMSQRNSTGAGTNPTVATVNGRPILSKVYEMYLKNGRDALGLDQNSPEGQRKLDQLREAIISELIDRALIRDEALRLNLSISPDRMAAAERKTVSSLGGDDRYNSYLAEHGFTRDEYKEIIMSEIYGELVRAELSKGLSVSEEDVTKYYQEHKKDAAFQLPERVTAAHILIAARPNLITQRLKSEKNLDGAALAAAAKDEMGRLRRRAEDLRVKASKGADFSSLAREHSDDTGTRDRGGDLGAFARGSHPPAFDEAAFTTRAGGISNVVQTDFGFHVIKVFKHEPTRVHTLEEVTPDIRRQLLGKLEAQKLTDWLKTARRKASVSINEPYRFGNLKTEFP